MKFSTNAFRQDHKNLLDIVGQITPLLNEATIKKDVSIIGEKLAALAGKLNIHLTMEDSGLYPFLLKSEDEQIKKTTQEFIDEMGGIKVVFSTYVAKWNGEEAILANISDFINETQGLFQALGSRIEKENTILYPLADNLDE